MQPAVDLATASASRFPGKRRRRGTNWGLRNPAGHWLHIESNIAAFDTAMSAVQWLADPQAFGKERSISFQDVDADALAQ